MHRLLPFLLFIASSLFALSCASNTVVQTGEIQVYSDENFDFTTVKTFSVVTQDMVDPPPDVSDEQRVFNQMVNGLIIKAMQAEPVCLEYIEPDQTGENPPDVWAANGLGQSTESGWVYQCCGGWWWGFWGWYWDPCATLCPVYVEHDVGSLLIPVGPPPDSDADPEVVFAGLARTILAAGSDPSKISAAVEAIFQQWPYKQSPCPAP